MAGPSSREEPHDTPLRPAHSTVVVEPKQVSSGDDVEDVSPSCDSGAVVSQWLTEECTHYSTWQAPPGNWVPSA